MRNIKCDECGDVIIELSIGSRIKPNIYALHEACPDRLDETPENGAERFRQQQKLNDMDETGIMDFFGKHFGVTK